MSSLEKEDFIRILKEPRNALIRQYIALLETEGITLSFSDDSIDGIADFACKINEQNENIGARRLHTIMERLIEDISFNAPELENKTITIDRPYVEKAISEIAENIDLTRYIL